MAFSVPDAIQQLDGEEDDEHDNSGFEYEGKQSRGHVYQDAEEAEADQREDAVNEPTKNGFEVQIHIKRGDR
jgi:hypothetical protein